MTPKQMYPLLIGLALTLFVVSLLTFFVGGSKPVSASTVAIGCSLLVIAASQKNKSDDDG